MRTPPALEKIRETIRALVRDQGNRSTTHSLLAQVKKWKSVERAYQAAREAEKRAPGWNYQGMLDDQIGDVIRAEERKQGRVTTGQKRKYINPVGATLSELDEAIAWHEQHTASHRAKLKRLFMIRTVALELGADVITEEIVTEADRRIASGSA